MPVNFRRFVREVPNRMPDDIARSFRRQNLEDHFRETRGTSPASAPTDIEKAKRLSAKMGADHLDDEVLVPRGLAQDAALDFGTGAAAHSASRALYEGLLDDPTWTRRLNNTFTGGAGTLRVDRPVSTAPSLDLSAPEKMGVGRDVAVTAITPWRMAENMVGDKGRAAELLTRVAERNFPGGLESAAVYHHDNLERQLNRPWLVWRDLRDGFDASSGTEGFADPVARMLFLNRGADPTAGGTPGQFNVGMHEAIHSLLDGTPPSSRFLDFQKQRPAVTDHKRFASGQAGYFQQDAAEMGNLLWQLKRQTEITNPDYPDIGATPETANRWLDDVQRWKPTGKDPVIRIEGHRNQGQPAHGYEEGMQWLQEIYESLGPDGLKDLRDMNWKTGQTQSLRESLLA